MSDRAGASPALGTAAPASVVGKAAARSGGFLGLGAAEMAAVLGVPEASLPGFPSGASSRSREARRGMRRSCSSASMSR